MTLVVALMGRESLWLMADRRLSIKNVPDGDDALKIMRLERNDDVALLGYAGLGRTPNKTQPSEWMNATLRGRNEPLERSLEILGAAINAQIPKYLWGIKHLGRQAHVVLAPAFVGGKPTLYTIELDLNQDTKEHRVRLHRHESGTLPRRHARVGLAGSGAPHLIGQRSRFKGLLRLVGKHEKKRVSAHTVAKELARLNFEVSKKEPSVGSSCIVVWSYRRNGPLKLSPAHESFSGLARANDHFFMPTNSDGVDVSGLVRAIAPIHMARLLGQEDSSIHDHEMLEALRRLPSEPDDKL